jgi:hypothetical protein
VLQTTPVFTVPSGWQVRQTGDLNGDGYDDLALGAAPQINEGSSGHAYLYFGGPKGFSAQPDLTFSSAIAGDQVYGVVGDGSDVNGDGTKDLIIGDGAAADGSQNGSIQIFLCGSTGPAPSPAQTLVSGSTSTQEQFPGTFN